MTEIIKGVFMVVPYSYVGVVVVGLVVLGADVVSGQDFPNKPIRIITAAAGGGSDFNARLVAQGVSGSLGQPVIVENRTPAQAAESVSKAQPDGYTLLGGGDTVWTLPLLRQTSYDPVRDFAPITLTDKSPNLLVLYPSVPANSVKELVALLKAKPGELNYGSGPTAGASHLASELFKAMAGVNMVRVPYNGGALSLNALISGEVQVSFATTVAAMQHVKSGRLRAVAVTSLQPSALAPGLPTVAASLPGYEFVGITGFFAPAKTPVSIINRLNQEIVRLLNREDVKEKFLNTGSEVVASSSEQFAMTINSEIAKISKVIKDTGIKAD